MSKDQKQESERKHRFVHKFLIDNFPRCEVTYNGVEGFDHQIIFNDNIVVVETKTCRKQVRHGVDRKRTHQHQGHMLFENVRLGQFVFKQQDHHPYHISQHRDLIETNGWYVFLIGPRNKKNIVGISARDLDRHIHGHWKYTRISWANILGYCSPDWLQHLKIQVYGVNKDDRINP